MVERKEPEAVCQTQQEKLRLFLTAFMGDRGFLRLKIILLTILLHFTVIFFDHP